MTGVTFCNSNGIDGGIILFSLLNFLRHDLSCLHLVQSKFVFSVDLCGHGALHIELWNVFTLRHHFGLYEVEQIV